MHQFQIACQRGVMVMGSNWNSWTHLGTLGQLTSILDESSYNELRSPDGHYAGWTDGEVWGLSEPMEGTMVGFGGNDRRSWRIGFRCAYDVQ